MCLCMGSRVCPSWNGVFDAQAAKAQWNEGQTSPPFSPGLVLFCFPGPHALTAKFQDHRVMDESVDGGHGRHRVFEDLIPLGKHQIAGDHHAAPFVAFG
jgi:hypothetical protein